MKCRAVLFDMDGTLVDSKMVVESEWELWARSTGVDIAEVLKFTHGRKTVDVLHHFVPERNEAEELERFLRLASTVDRSLVEPIPGAGRMLETLESMAGRPWAVVTSAPSDIARARLAYAGLPLPVVLIGADHVKEGKPSPEGFLSAAAALGVAPEECIVFEDAPAGVQAGISAGMRVIGLLTTFSELGCGELAAIRSYDEILVRADEPDAEIEITLRTGF